MVYAHLPEEETQCPFWIIELWKRVYDFKETHLKPWANSHTYLTSFSSSARSIEAKKAGKQAGLVFEKMGWDEHTTGYTYNTPVVHLSSLLSSTWLASDVLDLLLEELHLRLRTASSLLSIPTSAAALDPKEIIVDYTTLTFQIMKHYQTGRQDVELSCNGPKQHYLVRKAKDWSAKQAVVASIVHVDGVHWIPAIIDFKNERCLTGDSLTLRTRDDVAEALTWFAHLAGDKPRFTTDFLPITKQTESHSCGLWALDALHSYFGTVESLTSSNDFRLLRVRAFVAIGTRAGFLPMGLEGNDEEDENVGSDSDDAFEADDGSDESEDNRLDEMKCDRLDEDDTIGVSDQDDLLTISSGSSGPGWQLTSDFERHKDNYPGKSKQRSIWDSEARALFQKTSKIKPLDGYFCKVSKEEWREIENKKAEKAREEHQEMMETHTEDAKHNAMLKASRIRLQNKIRQQRKRERDRAKKEEKQTVRRQIKLFKTVLTRQHQPINALTQLQDRLTKTRREELAYETRPFRAEMYDNRISKILNKPDNLGPGRPPTNVPQHPTRVNWKGPITWKMIDAAAQRCTIVGKPNPRIIVHTLRTISPIFNLLHDKTLSKWIDKEKSINKVVWREKVQADAARTHKQVYSPGHAGVLVSTNQFNDIRKCTNYLFEDAVSRSSKRYRQTA